MWEEKALEIAKEAHTGQLDKGGAPYIQHPLAVSSAVQGDIEKAVALLHDVVEDTPITLKQLAALGFPPEIVDAVQVLTKQDGIDYQCYLLAIKQNPVARIVKIADLHHNMDISRLGREPTAEDRKRLLKYQMSVEYLTE